MTWPVEEALRLRTRAGAVHDPTVPEEDHPVGPAGVPGFVGDQHAGSARVASSAQHLQHGLAGLRVQCAGGLVGQYQPALPDQGAGDRGALLLATGQFAGEPVGQLGDAHLGQYGKRVAAGLPGRYAVQFPRQRHVLRGGQTGDQVEVLEHVSDRAAAQRGEFAGGQTAQFDTLDVHRAGAGPVQAASQGEQGGLSRP
jgi:hypothetical protein